MALKLLVRSADRLAGSVGSHHFIIALPDTVNEGTYRLKSAQIYNTAYTVTTGVNDKIYCSLGNKQVTQGYYSSGAAFATQLQTDLQTINASFTVAYSSTTGKFTFACSVAFSFQWANSVGDDCSDQLGFALANTTSGVSVTGDFIPVLPQSVSFLVNVSEAQSTDFYRSTNQKSDLLGTLRIPCDVGFGSLLNYLPKKHHEQYISLRGTRRLTIKLFDEQGRVLNLNGTDWSLELEKCDYEN